MKTVDQIVCALNERGLPLQRRQVFRDIAILGILPVGRRQRPQRYPDDTVDRILSSRGFEQEQPARIVSMKQLRALKGGRR